MNTATNTRELLLESSINEDEGYCPSVVEAILDNIADRIDTSSWEGKVWWVHNSDLIDLDHKEGLKLDYSYEENYARITFA
jgi:hypothetical protein